MGKKNPDLCERPYCRERYTDVVCGHNIKLMRSWTLRVCTKHAEPYRCGHSMLVLVRVTKRKT